MEGQALTDSLLTLFRRSGDAHVGQTLMRLARLAAATHQYETASSMKSEPHTREEPHQYDETGHTDARPTIHQTRTDAGAIHREVDR